LGLTSQTKKRNLIKKRMEKKEKAVKKNKNKIQHKKIDKMIRDEIAK